MNQSKLYSSNVFDILRFIFPSFLGLFIFLYPLDYKGAVTVPIAILIRLLKGFLEDIFPLIICFLILTTTFFSIVSLLLKPRFIVKSKFLSDLFLPSGYWMTVRFCGAILVAAACSPFHLNYTYIQATHDILDICMSLFCTFIFAGLFLPLLLEFGLINFIGIKSQNIMKKVFRLPGFSAVGCLTSWFGDGSLGVIITDNQYKKNQYTQREAAVVATNFSAVSITFMLIVLANVHLDHIFLEFYFTVCATGFIAAMIVPRLPPLSGMKDIYFNGSVKCQQNAVGDSSYKKAVSCAVAKVKSIDSVTSIFLNSAKNSLATILSVLPIVMAVGTIAYLIAKCTNIFTILGLPFFYIFDFIGLPEAKAASSVVMLGFADMLLPSMLTQDIDSEMVRFIIACLSVTQLVYLSEIGVLIVSSSIPLSLLDLFYIFLVRTLVCLPIVYLFSLFIF